MMMPGTGVDLASTIDSQLIVQPVVDEIVLYDVRSHRAFRLDARAARIWQALATQPTLDAVRHACPDETRATILATTRALVEEGIAPPDLAPAVGRVALSRRTLVRAVGLGALPLIVGLVAPPARAAVSTCSSVGQQCTTKPCCAPLDCAAGAVCQ